MEQKKNKAIGIFLITVMALSIWLPSLQVQAADDEVVVSTKAEFQQAIADGSAPTIKLAASIDITDVGVLDVDNLTIDLDGNTISAANFTAVFQGDNFKIMNGQMDAKGGSYALFIGDERETANVVVENITTNGGINIYDTHNVTLRNVNAAGTDYYAVWCDENALVTIESGSYQTNGVAVLGTAAISEDVVANIDVYGGIWNANQKPLVLDNGVARGKVTIYGGNYDIDPIGYLGDGYQAYPMNGRYAVAPSVAGITVDQTEASVEVGKTLTLNAVIDPVNTLAAVEWMSDDETVATVEAGKVTAKGTGTAKITAKAGNQSAECTVTVYQVKQPIVSDESKGSAIISASAVNEVWNNVKTLIAELKAGQESPAITFVNAEAKAALLNSLNVGINIVAEEVEENKITNDEMQMINEQLDAMSKQAKAPYKVGQYMDIRIMLTDNQQPLGNITALAQPLSMAIKVKDDLRAKAGDFYLLRIHDGVIERLGEYHDGMITFQTDRFSTYVLIYQEKMNETIIDKENGSTVNEGKQPALNEEDTSSIRQKTPNTANNQLTIAFLLIMLCNAVILLIFVVLLKIKLSSSIKHS